MSYTATVAGNKPKIRIMRTRVVGDIGEEIDRYAAEREITVSAAIRMLLRKGLVHDRDCAEPKTNRPTRAGTPGG